jgi:hypothetical protein
MITGKLSGKKLTEAASVYLDTQADSKIGISDFCVKLGISVQEWREMLEDPKISKAARRVETRIRAAMESDWERPVSLTSLLLKQFDQQDKEKADDTVKIILN